MKWDLPERTEDAIVAYLQAQCSGDMRISAAWERDEAQYPQVLVHAGTTEPVSEDAAQHDPRMLAVAVAVMTEAAHELDGNNAIMVSARERNAAARSQVMNALFASDLLTHLIAQNIADVAFSMAQFDSTARTTEGQVLVTTITGAVIAEPVEGS